jgi:hypothetical protein
MSNRVKTVVISFASAFAVAFVAAFLGVPTPMAGTLAGITLLVVAAYRTNNRSVTDVSPADRDQLLAQGPPANYGVVYLHRGATIGGLLVGFNVSLDHSDVALLRVARFTRLVVAPGTHQLVVGPRKQFGQLGKIAELQTAQASFAIAAGETAVFELKFAPGPMLRKLELVREQDAPSALTSLAKVKMVASVQPAVLA